MNNPFALFDLPVVFQVDSALLNERYLALQKSLHPDNFSAASAQEQRLAIQKSAEINDALRILKDPIARADSIIAINTGEQENPEEKSNKDIGFLMQQMEWREELAAARAANSTERLAALDSQVAAEEARLLTKLSTAFRQADYAQAAELVPQGRFLDKIRQEIRAAL